MRISKIRYIEGITNKYGRSSSRSSVFRGVAFVVILGTALGLAQSQSSITVEATSAKVTIPEGRVLVRSAGDYATGNGFQPFDGIWVTEPVGVPPGSDPKASLVRWADICEIVFIDQYRLLVGRFHSLGRLRFVDGSNRELFLRIPNGDRDEFFVPLQARR